MNIASFLRSTPACCGAFVCLSLLFVWWAKLTVDCLLIAWEDFTRLWRAGQFMVPP